MKENTLSHRVWGLKYRYRGETDWAATCARVCYAVYANELPLYGSRDVVSAAVEARELMESFLWMPAGRIIAGAGTDRHVTLLNCFVNATLQDSMKTDSDKPGLGILDALSNIALTLQAGGGIGTDFSPLRPRGAGVRLGSAERSSVASGPVSFMETADALSKTMASAGERRGAMMATLRIDHPDVEEFVTAKAAPGRLTQFNVSVLVSDAFMTAVELDQLWDLRHEAHPGDGRESFVGYGGYIYKKIRARALWDLITRTTYEHSEPGVIFVDRVNALNPLSYCEEISSTNPCFSGDTKAWTVTGPRRFDELAAEGKPALVLTKLDDGKLAYREMTKPRRTRRAAKLLKIVFRGSSRRTRGLTSLRVTPNHEFYLTDGSIKAAMNLRPGDSIVSAYRRPANQKGYINVNTRGDSVMEHWLAAEVRYGRRPNYPEEHAHHGVLGKSVNTPENVEIIGASEHNSEHMRGDNNPVRRFPERNPFRSIDFSGERNGRWRSEIKTEDLQTMRDAGLSYAAIAEKVGASKYLVAKRLGWNHRVVSVETLEEREDVYCGTVAATGRFFVSLGDAHAEGVLVSNCGEQPLPPDNACNLGHANLALMVKQPFTAGAFFDFDMLRRVARCGVRFLDNVWDVTRFPTEAQRAEGLAKRRIGLGVTGLANVFQQMRLRYGSSESAALTRAIFRALRDEAYSTSSDLAAARGSFPAYDPVKHPYGEFVKKLSFEVREKMKEHGLRNGVLLTVAPTGTTSAVYDNVSAGVEPEYALRQERTVIVDQGTKTKEVFESWGLRAFDRFWGPEIDKSKAGMPFYMATVESPDPRLRLTPADHLAIQAAAQEFVDASISKTVNVPADTPFEAFAGIYGEAYRLGCKGVTTYRPSEARGAVLRAVEDGGEDDVERDVKSGSAESIGVASGVSEIDTERTILDTGSDSRNREASSRPDDLPGRTYRRKIGADPAFYVTVCDRDGAPYELFVSIDASDKHEWAVALGRNVSMMLREGIGAARIAVDLAKVWPADGGGWLEGAGRRIGYVAAVADVLRAHVERADPGAQVDRYWHGQGRLGDVAAARARAERHRADYYEKLAASVPPAPGTAEHRAPEKKPTLVLHTICPACRLPAVRREEGCSRCGECGWSNCG